MESSGWETRQVERMSLSFDLPTSGNSQGTPEEPHPSS